MSTLFVRTLREDPVDAEVASHKWLVRAGYIRRAAPGIYSWLPLGLRVLGKLETIVREEMARAGSQEVHFPALLPRDAYEATGRWTEYGPNLFRLQDRKGNDMLLAPTHEEMFTLMVSDLYSSYRDLPVTLYQIQTKYRDEARPRAGLIRGREFIMKDAYSFDMDEAGLEVSYQTQRDAYERIFNRLGLDYVIVAASAGAMGGSRSEEFLHPCDIGEDTFVRSPGGYAANVEAVTTVAPPEQDASGVPPAQVYDTPDSATIDSLITVAREVIAHPQGGEWQASDTLKNVIVALQHPDDSVELIAIGVPGDRQVDAKRLEAAVYPAEVTQATEEQLAQHPELVPGYIGPQVLGPNSPHRQEDGTGSIRYFVDPRVVAGSSWITGANEAGKHVAHLVYGRDFTADGVLDVAEVLAGDPAPDGSGALELARGIEIGHIFALGTKYSEALGLKVLDPQGKAVTVTMGSYGLGVTRVLAALAEKNSDDAGLSWPIHVAPFQVHIVATGKDEAVYAKAEEMSSALSEQGIEVLFDDRARVSPGVKFADAEILGMPLIVVVGKNLAQGEVELRIRATGERRNIPVQEAVAAIKNLVADLLAGTV